MKTVSLCGKRKKVSTVAKEEFDRAMFEDPCPDWKGLVTLSCDPETDTLLKVETEGERTFVVDAEKIKETFNALKQARWHLMGGAASGDLLVMIEEVLKDAGQL